MKILQVITSLKTGGAEKLILDSVPLYQQKKIEMDVLTMKKEETPFYKQLKQSSNGSIDGLTKGSVYNPILIFKIIPYLRNYDVLHIHLFPSLYWVVLAKWLSFSKTKLVYTEHSTGNRRRENWILKLIDRFIYRGIDKVITISNDVDSNLKTHLKFEEDFYALIENGINVSLYSNAIAWPKNDFFEHESFILIQVSSFREQKDQATLIKALKFLPEDIRLLLVGDGPLKKQHENLSKNLGLEERIIFLGLRDDVPKLMKTADVAVLSSNHEGLSLASIEGMASGPFVASRVPGLREIVDGYGLLFQKGNERELAECVLKLYHDKKYYNEIALKCLQRAEEFDIIKMVNSYIDIYKIVLKNV